MLRIESQGIPVQFEYKGKKRTLGIYEKIFINPGDSILFPKHKHVAYPAMQVYFLVDVQLAFHGCVLADGELIYESRVGTSDLIAIRASDICAYNYEVIEKGVL